MIKLFKKPTKLYFLSLFQQVWTLIFMGLGFMLNICFRRSCCQPDRKITRQTKTDTSQNHHTTGRSNKSKRQWLFLKRLFSPRPVHYCLLPWFLEEFLNVLIQQFELFSVLGQNWRSHMHAMLFNSYFVSPIWLSHKQFCIISKKTASLT